MTVLDSQPEISSAIPPRGMGEELPSRHHNMADIQDINARVGDFGNSTYAAHP